MYKAMKIFCVQQKYLPAKKYYPPGKRIWDEGILNLLFVHLYD